MPLLTTELALALDEALAPDRVCEGRKDHQTPAIWWCIPSCGCGAYAYCALCHQSVVDGLSPAGTCVCTRCDARVTLRWEAIRR